MKKASVSMMNRVKLGANTKVVLSFGLMAILFVSSFVNYSMFDSKERENSISLTSVSPVNSTRGIASVGQLDAAPKVGLNREMVKANIRKAASVGTKPSQLDQLAFGLLEGKYAIKMNDGKVTEIKFSDAQNFGDRPKYVNDRVSFIDDHKNLLPVKFQNIKVLKKSSDDFSTTETYSLMDSDNGRVGRVQFQLDDKGRLLSMLFTKGNRIAAN